MTPRTLAIRLLLRWTIIALVAGLVGSVAVVCFRWLLATSFDAVRGFPVPPPLVGIAAALVAGLLYRISPGAAGEGIPSYLRVVSRAHGRFSRRATVLKLPAAFVTLVGYGSGGLVGPLGRACAGVLAAVFRDSRTAALCGMSAAVGAIFSAPIGGGLFAVEIVQKANMRYSDLFPAILASTISVWVASLLGWEPVIPAGAVATSLPPEIFPMVLLVAVVAALLGGGFTKAYAFAVTTFRRERGTVFPKLLVGMALSVTLVWLVNPALFGPALAVIEGIVDGTYDSLYGVVPRSVPVLLAIIVMVVVRVTASCLTIGSGMSAGIVAPVALVGMLAGVAVAVSFNVEPGSVSYVGLVAGGFAGMMASAMNVPIAAAVLAVEVFGLAYSVPAGLAAVIGFQINRHRTIYELAGAGGRTMR